MNDNNEYLDVIRRLRNAVDESNSLDIDDINIQINFVKENIVNLEKKILIIKDEFSYNKFENANFLIKFKMFLKLYSTDDDFVQFKINIIRDYLINQRELLKDLEKNLVLIEKSNDVYHKHMNLVLDDLEEKYYNDCDKMDKKGKKYKK